MHTVSWLLSDTAMLLVDYWLGRLQLICRFALHEMWGNSSDCVKVIWQVIFGKLGKSTILADPNSPDNRSVSLINSLSVIPSASPLRGRVQSDAGCGPLGSFLTFCIELLTNG